MSIKEKRTFDEEKKNGMNIVTNMNGEERADKKLMASTIKEFSDAEIVELKNLGYDINFDMNFKAYRCAECPDSGIVILLLEFIHSSADREISLEFEGKNHIFGNMKGRWVTHILTKWYKGMEYTTTVNGRKFTREIKKHDLDRNILTYKNKDYNNSIRNNK